MSDSKMVVPLVGLDALALIKELQGQIKEATQQPVYYHPGERRCLEAALGRAIEGVTIRPIPWEKKK